MDGTERKDERCNPGDAERREKDLDKGKKAAECSPDEEEMREKAGEKDFPDGDEQRESGAEGRSPFMEAFEGMKQGSDGKLQDVMTIDDFVDKFIDHTLERTTDCDARLGQDLDALATALINEILDSLAREAGRGFREACIGRERFEEGVNSLVDNILRKITKSITAGGQLIPPLGENGKPEEREFKITIPKLMFNDAGDHRNKMDAGFDVMLKWERVQYPQESHTLREGAANVDVRGDIFAGARVEKICVFGLPQDKAEYRTGESHRLDDIKAFIGPQLPSSFDDVRKIQPITGPLLPPEGCVRPVGVGVESKPTENWIWRRLCCGFKKQKVEEKPISPAEKFEIVVS